MHGLLQKTGCVYFEKAATVSSLMKSIQKSEKTTLMTSSGFGGRKRVIKQQSFLSRIMRNQAVDSLRLAQNYRHEIQKVTTVSAFSHCVFNVFTLS